MFMLDVKERYGGVSSARRWHTACAGQPILLRLGEDAAGEHLVGASEGKGVLGSPLQGAQAMLPLGGGAGVPGGVLCAAPAPSYHPSGSSRHCCDSSHGLGLALPCAGETVLGAVPCL